MVGFCTWPRKAGEFHCKKHLSRRNRSTPGTCSGVSSMNLTGRQLFAIGVSRRGAGISGAICCNAHVHSQFR
jgi:hypothetical protein